MAKNFKVDPKSVYTTENISSVMKDSNKSLEDMDIDKLETAYRDAQNLKGLQNEQIMNQTIQMPVLTGQAAHMGRLWDLKINAIGSLYQAKESQLQREADEIAPYKQAFMNEFGYMPDDMGDKEKEMIQQRYQEKYNMDVAEFNKKMSSGGGGGTDKMRSGVQALLAQGAERPEYGREWAAEKAEELYGEAGRKEVESYTDYDNWEERFKQPEKPRTPSGDPVLETDGEWQYYSDGTRIKVSDDTL